MMKMGMKVSLNGLWLSGGPRRAWALALALLVAGQGALSLPALACYDTSAQESRAKNVILFVVDGFGFGTQALARQALAGTDSRLKLESLPYIGVMNHSGRTRAGFDANSALWELFWGLRADAGERPPYAEERATWLSVARSGGRAVGVITDGLLSGYWPLGALVQPVDGKAEAGQGAPLEALAEAPPDFLFGRVGENKAWAEAAPSLAGRKIQIVSQWGEGGGAGRVWYALSGGPGDPLAGSVSPAPAEVMARALERLAKAPQGFVLVVHFGGLGEALAAHDLASAIAHLGQIDEAVGQAVSFAEQTEGTALLFASTGDPVNVTLVDGFSPRRLDGVQQSVRQVAAAVKSSGGAEAARELVRQGLGLEVEAAELAAWQGLAEADLQRALGDRLAGAAGVRFTAGETAVNPVPLLAYGPGSWVYGRLLDATEIPALVVAQLWLDPAQLSSGTAGAAALTPAPPAN